MVATSKEKDHELSWQASEYVHNEKSFSWFVLFGLGSGLLLAGTFVILNDLFSLAVVTMMVATIGVFANRKPRSLEYKVDDQGVKIASREYDYSSFKSFSIMDYGAVESVYLEPLERFMPAISMYFAPDDGDKIVGILGQYLPHRDRDPDFVDRLVHKIRL